MGVYKNKKGHEAVGIFIINARFKKALYKRLKEMCMGEYLFPAYRAANARV